MVEEKASVPFKIAEGMIMIVWSVFSRESLGECHRLGCFTGHTNMIKVNGVVKFVLFRNDDNGIARNSLFDGNVDTEEKKDHESTKEYYGCYLVFLSHSHHSSIS